MDRLSRAFRRKKWMGRWLLGGWLLGVLQAEVREVDGVDYHIVTAKADAVRVLWKDDEGRSLRTFPAVFGYLRNRGERPVLVMNGGIFEPGGVPSGLLVQAGKELHPVNRAKGRGNFYLEPNGVFYVAKGECGVVRTDEWPVRGEVREAVQSGPLLLRKGKIHPAFVEGSVNRLHRNGVGVRPDGTIVLAMTDFHSPKFPNLHEFATLFRSLGCEDALFLDGDISRMEREGEAVKDRQAYGSFVVIIGDA